MPDDLRDDVVKWMNLCKKIDRHCDELHKILGVAHDSKTIELYCEAVEMVQKNIEEKYNIEGNWLEYFQHECKFGQINHAVTLKCGKEIIIRGVEDIIDVIIN